MEMIRAETSPIVAPFAPTGQVTAFPAETFFEPLTLMVAYSFKRLPRGRCSSCGNRRVRYAIVVGDLIMSAPVCARCAKLR